MNKVKLSKAVELTGKSRIFFRYNKLTKKDESGVFVEFDDLKRVITAEVENANEHLRRLETFQNQTNK